jgi:DNA-binding transcriptional LysR family regulator
VTLTEEGSRYYGKCVEILQLVELAGDEARGKHSAPAGSIRVSCTAAIGVLHISRLIFEFQDRYPQIGIDLNLTDERINLVREGVDIAIRLGPLADSAMRLRSLGHSRRLLVASPQYLAKRGRPAQPAELRGHDTIRMSNIAGSDSLRLVGPAMDEHDVPFDGRLRVDHGLAARQALIAGRGIAPAHLWLVSDLLESGVLEIVLADYSIAPVPLNLLIVPQRAGVARVRLLVDFLTRGIARIPGMERRPK